MSGEPLPTATADDIPCFHCEVRDQAVCAVLDHSFAQQGVESVIAIVEPDHQASIRVVEKAGFGSFVCMPYHGREVRIYRKTAPSQLGGPRGESRAR